MIEIYNGGFSSNTIVDYSEDVKTKIALHLNEEEPEDRSPYVEYNGKLYKVLYNDENGIEIIAMELEDGYQFGVEDEYLPEEVENDEYDEKIKWSYNNCIESLNRKVKEIYPKSSVISDARSVGSVPGNKNHKNTALFVENLRGQTEGYEYGEEIFDYPNNTLIYNQPNYTSDYNRMSQLEILWCEGQYYLASRYAWVDNAIRYSANLYIYTVYTQIEKSSFIEANDDGIGCTNISFYLRPVLKLSYGVKIKDDGGDGSSSKPYVLE